MPTDIQVAERTSAMVQTQPPENHTLVAVMDKLANNPNLDADKIERLMNVFLDGQRRMAEMQDEKAFAEAMADFKKNPPQIVKSREARMEKDGRLLYAYKFADLAAYADAVMPGLAERGITWSFPFSESNGVITVSCILRYGLYEQKATTFSAPADTTGGKNAIQAKASTLSYLERYTFCGATGMVAAMPDTDGKPPAGTPKVEVSEKDEIELQTWADALKQAPDLARLKGLFADAYRFAGEVGGQPAKVKMLDVFEDMKRKLGGAK